MTIKNTALAVILAASAVTLNAQKSKGEEASTFVAQNLFKDYVPVSPIEFEQDVIIYDASLPGKFDTLSLKELSASKKKVIEFLPNESVFVSVQKTDAAGNVTLAPASITAAKGTYTVIIDYCKFTSLKSIKKENTCIGFAKVGVGLRITANIETSEDGISTGSLFGLGLAAEMGKLKGTMSLEVIGMESSQISELIPMPSDIGQTAIQNALQSLAAIKTKIYDEKTRLYPQIMAVKRAEGECTIFDVLKNLEKGTR